MYEFWNVSVFVPLLRYDSERGWFNMRKTFDLRTSTEFQHYERDPHLYRRPMSQDRVAMPHSNKK
jgi:hypothetical protein